MTFDPMATAIDWLDAYRDEELETILSFYAEDASVECSCGGLKIMTGRDALRAYWERRLLTHPAGELNDLRPSPDGAFVTYSAGDGAAYAVIEFDGDGRIKHYRCHPFQEVVRPSSRRNDDLAL